MMPEYLENSVFQKLSNFPFNLCVLSWKWETKGKRKGKNILFTMT